MKNFLTVVFAVLLIGISSGRALSQTIDATVIHSPTPPMVTEFSTITFRPPIIAKFQDESGSLPGIGFTTGDKIAVAAVGLAVVGLAVVLIHNHNRHHPTNKLSSLLDQKLDVNFAFNNNLKEVGFRYAFK